MGTLKRTWHDDHFSKRTASYHTKSTPEGKLTEARSGVKPRPIDKLNLTSKGCNRKNGMLVGVVVEYYSSGRVNAEIPMSFRHPILGKPRDLPTRNRGTGPSVLTGITSPSPAMLDKN